MACRGVFFAITSEQADAQALAAFTEDAFAERYRTIVPQDYAPEYGDDDRAYTWEYFQGVRDPE